MESTLWAKRNDVLEGDVLGTQCTNVIFLIGIHNEAWSYKKKHTKRLKHTGNLF